ncbi:MAG: hypothetical protein IKN50_05585 [Clostridia bacterium]|nr:hypothetical protein [Clostridia bacterium]
MKKPYTKPKLVFDSFEVATNIASCSRTSEHEQNGCAVTAGGMPIYTNEVSGCRFTMPDGSYGICYYVLDADNTVFGS